MITNLYSFVLFTDFVLPQQQNAQINNQQKDLSQSKPSGWEEPSPPTQRRNIPNYDDGTSLWGQQQQAPQQQSNQQQAGQQQQPVPLPQNRVNRLQVGESILKSQRPFPPPPPYISTHKNEKLFRSKSIFDDGTIFFSINFRFWKQLG